jgi:hypothetical protein
MLTLSLLKKSNLRRRMRKTVNVNRKRIDVSTIMMNNQLVSRYGLFDLGGSTHISIHIQNTNRRRKT